MDYFEAACFLNSLIDNEKGFEKYSGSNYDPQKVEKLLDQANLIDSNIKIVHIAGTKGKGSTSFYLAKLIGLSTNVNVGLYTSPHLFRINERIKINFADISDQSLSGLVSRFSGLIIEFKATFFDALTFIAMAHFIERECGYVVLETGLGGKLDSTNYCKPILSVITSIAYDHTAILGNTLQEIAGEKAGIIKHNIPVISAPQANEALKIIKEKALEKQSVLYYFPDYIHYNVLNRSPSGSVWDSSINMKSSVLTLTNIELSQIGDVFIENFLLALFSCLIISQFDGSGKLTAGMFKNQGTLIKSAAALRIPFRMEIAGNNLIDVSHNDSSLKSLFKTITVYMPENNYHLFIGILADKEIERIAGIIEDNSSLFTQITVYDFISHRKSGGERLFRLLNKLKNVDYLSDISLIKPQKDPSKGFNVFTGSFYTVERILDIIKK